jgi:hypothetical protein
MPVTPSGVSKYLSHHGFDRAKTFRRQHGREALLAGFATSSADSERIGGSVVVQYIGTEQEEHLEAYLEVLAKGGYKVKIDPDRKVLIIKGRKKEAAKHLTAA